MAEKIKDLVVSTGSYQNRYGEEKKRYENVGVLWKSDDGYFVTLKRTFNPAGVPTDRDTIMINAFDPKPRDGQESQKTSGGQKADLDDEIPY